MWWLIDWVLEYILWRLCRTANYYLMIGFSRFASLIWSVFISILRIVTLSSLIVFLSFCQHKQQTAATTGSPWCFGLCYEEPRSRCGKQFESIDWHSSLNLRHLLWWFDNTRMLSHRKLRSAGTKNSMTGSKRWKLTTRNWFKILMKSTSPWDGWDASKHWANGNSLLVTLLFLLLCVCCFFQLHANFFSGLIIKFCLSQHTSVKSLITDSITTIPKPQGGHSS